MQNRNIIIVSSIDWETQWQWHHEIVSYLNKNNNRVLFIENTGTRRLKINEVGRVYRKIISLIKNKKSFNILNDKLVRFSPFFIPFPYNYLSRKINSFLIIGKLQKWMNINKFNDVIIISFLPTPIANSIINNLRPILSVYLCADDYSNFSTLSKKLKYWENQFIKKVDLIFTSSTIKMHQFKKNNSNLEYFFSGVNFDLFNKVNNEFKIPQLKNNKVKIIGFHGALRSILDKNLLLKIANKFQDAKIVLIGPKYDNFKKLENYKNIIFIDEIKHSEIPKYINNFDIGILPYKVNEFTNSVNPAKLNEYLILGIPVVSKNIEQIKNFNTLNNETINIANNDEEFLDLIDKIFSKKIITDKNKLIKTANKYDWENILSNFTKKIDEEANIKNKNYKFRNKITNYYYRGKVSLIKFIFLVFFFFFLYISPLPSYLGSFLVVKNEMIKSDAIVALTGPGEGTYYNFGYQKRYIEINKLVKDGISDQIILISSVKRYLSETALLKSLLIDNGIDVNQITIIDSNANNTAKLIEKLGQTIEEKNFKQIVFLTSPYHSKRSDLIWNKKFPDIKVLHLSENYKKNDNIKWFLSFNNIKIICYEYAAIVHNYLKGNL
jgi:uncharacterized SAM-binding protein YcdF (DUF218 family)